MRVAVYPGSFDPITKGHIDIIKRGVKIFDKVVVAILVNVDKKGLFSIEERKELILKSIDGLKGVEVISYEGMLVNLLKENDFNIILKGLRNSTDFEYENTMALINKKLNREIETVFLLSDLNTSYISSSAVKQILKFGGDISDMVSKNIIEDINKKINLDK